MGGAVGWGVGVGVEVGVGMGVGVVVGPGLLTSAGTVVGPLIGEALLSTAPARSEPGLPAEAAGRVPASTAPIPAMATTATSNETRRGQRRRPRRALGV